MKLQLTTHELLPALAALKSLVNPHNTLPILDCVLLEPLPNALRLTATNHDHTRSLRIPAVIEGDALPIAVPHNALHRLVAGINRTVLTMETQMTSTYGARCPKITVGDGSRSFFLPGLSAEEFPPHCLAAEDAASLTTSSRQLAALLRKLRPFASTDETRYVLRGVALVPEHGLYTCVATDGRRIQVITTPLEAPDQRVHVLPIRAVDELIAMAEPAGSITLRLDGVRYTAHHSKGAMQSGRLIQGNFPNFRLVVPAASESGIGVPTDELRQALEFLNALEERDPTVFLTPEDGRLILHSRNPNNGLELRAEVEATIRGTAPKTAFNTRFLAEIAREHPEQWIFLQLRSDLEPVRIDSLEGWPTTSVLMPRRLREQDGAPLHTLRR